MFLPCKYNTKDKEEGWINTDYIVDVLFNGDSVIAYTVDEARCSYIIELENWQTFITSIASI